MRHDIGHGAIEIVQGDITHETTEAIVNAANARLEGGGGVDGAIHAAGGPAIMEECRTLGGCPTGQARITTAGNLKAKNVIHTVGPIYRDGCHEEPEQLAECYLNSLELAKEHGLRTVAFPAISCGVYGYPHGEAAQIAIQTVADFLRENAEIKLVRFVLFTSELYSCFRDALATCVE